MFHPFPYFAFPQCKIFMIMTSIVNAKFPPNPFGSVLSPSILAAQCVVHTADGGVFLPPAVLLLALGRAAQKNISQSRSQNRREYKE